MQTPSLPACCAHGPFGAYSYSYGIYSYGLLGPTHIVMAYIAMACWGLRIIIFARRLFGKPSGVVCSAAAVDQGIWRGATIPNATTPYQKKYRRNDGYKAPRSLLRERQRRRLVISYHSICVINISCHSICVINN